MTFTNWSLCTQWPFHCRSCTSTFTINSCSSHQACCCNCYIMWVWDVFYWYFRAETFVILVTYLHFLLQENDTSTYANPLLEIRISTITKILLDTALVSIPLSFLSQVIQWNRLENHKPKIDKGTLCINSALTLFSGKY